MGLIEYLDAAAGSREPGVLLEDGSVVRGHLIGFGDRRDVLAQVSEEDSESFLAELLCGAEGVLRLLAGHETAHGTLHEGPGGDGLPQALVAGHPEEGRAHRSHEPMVP